MKTFDLIQIVLFFGALLLFTPILGKYMAKVFSGDFSDKPSTKNYWNPLRYFRWFEKVIFKICGIKSDEQMNWKSHTIALLVFNLIGSCLPDSFYKIFMILNLIFIIPLYY